MGIDTLPAVHDMSIDHVGIQQAIPTQDRHDSCSGPVPISWHAVYDRLANSAMDRGLSMTAAIRLALGCGRTHATRLAKATDLGVWGLDEYDFFCQWAGINPVDLIDQARI